jgi:hypothetical protein
LRQVRSPARRRWPRPGRPSVLRRWLRAEGRVWPLRLVRRRVPVRELVQQRAQVLQRAQVQGWAQEQPTLVRPSRCKQKGRTTRRKAGWR